MEQAQHGGENFVLRRSLTGSILVATHHPVIGPVFLEGVESSEMGVPDSYGLVTDIVRAKRYKPGAAPHGLFEDRVRGDWVKLVKMAEVSPSAIAFWTRPKEITREIDTTVARNFCDAGAVLPELSQRVHRVPREMDVGSVERTPIFSDVGRAWCGL
jgi:hypothetical protein